MLWRGSPLSSMRPWVLTVTVFGGVILMAAAAYVTTTSLKHLHGKQEKSDKALTRIAFLGNSIFYYNDCPRLLQHMMTNMIQNSCLRGGASLVALWIKGNGMQEKFESRRPLAAPGFPDKDDIGAPTVQALLTNVMNTNDTSSSSQQQHWDYVLMNDFTQAPARNETRQETIESLKQNYAPMIRQCGATPVFLQTAAYRKEGIRETEDLGSVEEFTRLLHEGYQAYAKALATELPPQQQPRIAPAGDAYLYVHNHNVDLWNKLYWHDDFHPSPYGTWLQACVLYCTIMNQAPPIYNPKWFDTARYFPDEKLEFPTLAEAHELRQVACVVCGIGGSSEEELADPQ